VADPLLLIPGQRQVNLTNYQQIVLEQLTELWTNYGDLAEVWFDGGSPIPGVGKLLSVFQPDSVAFQGPADFPNSIRWVGTEDGYAPYPCWSTAQTSNSYGPGGPDYPVWAPAETDLTVRRADRWFWTGDYYKIGVKNISELMYSYERSVGRNTNFLLNISPDPFGELVQEDYNMYVQLGNAIKDCYEKSFLGQVRGIASPTLVLDLGNILTVSRVVISEDQTFSQRVRAYSVLLSNTLVQLDNPSQILASNITGISIGNKKIEVLDPPVQARYITFVPIAAIDTPIISKLAAYNCKKWY